MAISTSRRLAATAGALTLVAAGCGSVGASGGGGAGADGKIEVVASTSAWGSVVSAVGGDQVAVTAIIDDPAADPHSYESTAADGLAVAEAGLMVYNGGGYDDFAHLLADQAPDMATIEAMELSGHGSADGHQDEDEGHEDDGADGGGHDHAENEHVWYDLDTVAAMADAVAERLGELEPDSAATFDANAAEFKDGLGELEDALAEIAEQHPGLEVAATEPVSHYLLDHAGLTDVTPENFSEAIESGTDVPAAALDEVIGLVDANRITVLINNPQTESPTTEHVVAAAERAGVPVVEISETLPEGESDYLAWVGAQVAELGAAVSG